MEYSHDDWDVIYFDQVFAAVSNGHLAVVPVLVLKPQTRYDRPMLHDIDNGHIEITRFFLEHRVNIRGY